MFNPLDHRGMPGWGPAVPGRDAAAEPAGTSSGKSGTAAAADRPAGPGPGDDVIDLLLAQHARIEELLLLVTGSAGEARKKAFDDLVRLLAMHETAEEELIHPLSRRLDGAGGDAMVEDRLAEERQAEEALTASIDGGVDADGFDTGLLLLRTAVLEHARHEERYEFPHLRARVPAERPRRLATAFAAAEKVAPARPHPARSRRPRTLRAGRSWPWWIGCATPCGGPPTAGTDRPGLIRPGLIGPGLIGRPIGMD
ncbi:hemerythrin domain-containing protein [Dactylosporangium sp. CA-052675]|uniref:hemerythrin domain-containing protein n=1 Tax=Dactylosporangium sp. CA-052675 TaxID=3239927 RepID=UPI003D8D8FB1